MTVTFILTDLCTISCKGVNKEFNLVSDIVTVFFFHI